MPIELRHIRRPHRSHLHTDSIQGDKSPDRAPIEQCSSVIRNGACRRSHPALRRRLPLDREESGMIDPARMEEPVGCKYADSIRSGAANRMASWCRKPATCGPDSPRRWVAKGPTRFGSQITGGPSPRSTSQTSDWSARGLRRPPPASRLSGCTPACSMPNFPQPVSTWWSPCTRHSCGPRPCRRSRAARCREARRNAPLRSSRHLRQPTQPRPASNWASAGRGAQPRSGERRSSRGPGQHGGGVEEASARATWWAWRI